MINPQISVVMPVYNREQYLRESIESILNQTFADFEFIIVDDQSTDSSWQIIQEYANKDKRIVAVKNTGKKGCYPARNCGHRLAKGKYIAVMDSDDIALPQRLQTQFEFLEKNSNVSFCSAWLKNFEASDDIITLPTTHKEIRDTLFFNCCFSNGVAMFKNDPSIEYATDFNCSEDYDLWCRKIDLFQFANIPKVLLLYRRHSSQTDGVLQNNVANKVRLNNIQKIGVTLSEEEKNFYLEIFSGKFFPKNKSELLLATKMLNNILTAGIKHKYKNLFKSHIQKFIRNVAETGIQNGITSLKLYFTIFKKWRIFETPRANLRYIYHCFRNLLHL